MNRDQELALGDRLMALFTDGPSPADGAPVAVPASVYTCPDRHRAELAAVAARPVAALHGTEIPEAGDFRAVELGGLPLLVVRGRDGVVRALVNACAHRGATVEREAEGTARAFSCSFHGWSYELDGTLRSVADAALFSSAPCGRGLRCVPCEERHGVIWVTTDPDPAPRSVAEWLGADLDELLTMLGFGDAVFYAAVEYDVACNWKLLTDGFLELYHLKYLHRTTIAPYLPANSWLVDRYGEHFRVAIPKNRLGRHLAASARDEWELWSDLSLPVVLMPGSVLQWQAGHYEVFSFRPDPNDPGRTRCRLSMLVPADRADEHELWERNWERVRVTIPDEDFAVAEQVQRNIASGAVRELQIGRNEQGLVDHLAAVDRLVAEVARR